MLRVRLGRTRVRAEGLIHPSHEFPARQSPCWPACGPLALSMEALWPGSSLPVRISSSSNGRRKSFSRPDALPLHEAQTRALARDYGFASWNKLREDGRSAHTRISTPRSPIFIQAATDGRPDRAKRLLALHPKIAPRISGRSLILGRCRGRSTRDSRKTPHTRRNKEGGPRALRCRFHHICIHVARIRRSCRHRAAASSHVARDPNSKFPWLHHGVRRPVLWGAFADLTVAAAWSHALCPDRTRRRSERRRSPLPTAACAGDVPSASRHCSRAAPASNHALGQ
jgi:hypothetical protein